MSVFSHNEESVGEEHWISVSDLMGALMMIFLLLALFYMIQIDEDKETKIIDDGQLLVEKKNLDRQEANSRLLIAEKDRMIDNLTGSIKDLALSNRAKEEKINTLVSNAVIYDDVIEELHQSLLGEFNADLNKWNAELRDDLTFRFNEPNVLFDTGDTAIKVNFKAILNDFFPRYLRVITSEKFRADIAEVRIEGHTSSLWGDLPKNSPEAYFNNMRLSQERSRNTLFYVMGLPEVTPHYDWLKDKLTANGLSSSKPVDVNGYLLDSKSSNGIEDQLRSQRVDFRVRIDAESKISNMLDSGALMEETEDQ
jgi:outer membrane protein OmpA-like peptidoglycan-associated protein